MSRIDSAASSAGSTVNFILIYAFWEVLFLIYTLPVSRWSPKEITKHQALASTIFLMFTDIQML